MQVFSLFSSVIFRIDHEKVVFYNTDSFCAKSFQVSPTVREICQYFDDINNLYTILVTDKRRNFCLMLQDFGFGKIHEDTDIMISFPPSLILRNDWEKIKYSVGEDNTEILRYLSEVVLFLGGRKESEKNLFYQTEYPYPGNEILEYAHLMEFIDKVSNIHKIALKFIIPFVGDYPNISNIILKIKDLKNNYTIFIQDREYYGNVASQHALQDIQENVVVINDSRQMLTKDISNNVHNRFLIFDEKSAVAAQEIVKEKALIRYSFEAVFDGSNEQFIRQVTFPTESELLNGSYTKKHIFAHQVLNTFYFGRLFITPDGKVYSNLMENAIGTIKSSFHALIKSELNNNYSWRRTRYSKPSCCSCRLIDFCPSISPLECYMGANCIINRLF